MLKPTNLLNQISRTEYAWLERVIQKKVMYLFWILLVLVAEIIQRSYYVGKNFNSVFLCPTYNWDRRRITSKFLHGRLLDSPVEVFVHVENIHKFDVKASMSTYVLLLSENIHVSTTAKLQILEN